MIRDAPAGPIPSAPARPSSFAVSPETASSAERIELCGIERPLDLAHALVVGFGALASALTTAFDLMSDIALPEPVAVEIDLARMQAVALLYLASELEEAGLIPAAELCAALLAAGALPIADEATSQALAAFWRGRHERFARDERRALFDRLFGTTTRANATPAGQSSGIYSGNGDFTLRLFEVADAIVSAETPSQDLIQPTAPPPYHTLFAANLAARRLIETLLTRAGGIVAFAAGELTATLSTAVALFKMRPLQTALGAPAFWSAIAAALARYGVSAGLPRAQQPDEHVRRGRSGMIVLLWCAESVGSGAGNGAGSGAPPQAIAPAVRAAALAWLQASATLQNSVSS